MKLPRDNGGLGVGDLEAKNNALLGKCLWRFPSEPDSFRHKCFLARGRVQAQHLEEPS